MGAASASIATSWSDNPRKGAATLAWLDRNLDHARYELTFAGRAPATFEHIRVVGPLDSQRRSRRSCARRTCTSPRATTIRARTRSSRRSRAGCPRPSAKAAATPSSSVTAGSRSGDDEELGDVLERLVGELDERRAAISVHPISWVADRYLDVLGLGAAT